MTYSITNLIVSDWGKQVGIAPRTDGTYEIYNVKDEFLGVISYYRKWKCLVWKQEENIIMSKSCLDEAFQLVENYRKEQQEETSRASNIKRI